MASSYCLFDPAIFINREKLETRNMTHRSPITASQGTSVYGDRDKQCLKLRKNGVLTLKGFRGFVLMTCENWSKLNLDFDFQQ